MASRSTSDGTDTTPDGPIARTGPTIRDTRNERGAARSRSWPTTYHRPRHDTTPHGSTVRRATSPAGPPRR